MPRTTPLDAAIMKGRIFAVKKFGRRKALGEL